MGVAEDLRGKVVQGLRRLQVSGLTRLDGGLSVVGPTALQGPATQNTFPLAVQPQTFFGFFGSANFVTSATQPSPVMVGLATAAVLNPPSVLTPLVTGRVRYIMTADISNGTTGASSYYSLRFGTGAAPIQGAAAAGTRVGAQKLVGFVTGTFTYPSTINWVFTGLVLGTQYWFDLDIGSNNGGTTTFNFATIELTEF